MYIIVIGVSSGDSVAVNVSVLFHIYELGNIHTIFSQQVVAR